MIFDSEPCPAVTMVEFAEELSELLSHDSLIVLFSMCGLTGENTGYGEFKGSPES